MYRGIKWLPAQVDPEWSPLQTHKASPASTTQVPSFSQVTLSHGETEKMININRYRSWSDRIY